MIDRIKSTIYSVKIESSLVDYIDCMAEYNHMSRHKITKNIITIVITEMMNSAESCIFKDDLMFNAYIVNLVRQMQFMGERVVRTIPFTDYEILNRK